MPGLTVCEGQSPDRSSRTCPAPFSRRVSSVPLIPVPPPLTHPPTDNPFCSSFTTLLRSWPSAVHPPAQAYAQCAVTGAVGSAPAIAGVGARRRHRRRRESLPRRTVSKSAKSVADYRPTFDIAVFPILADAVDVKRGDQLCETVSQPSIQLDKVVRPMGS